MVKTKSSLGPRVNCIVIWGLQLLVNHALFRFFCTFPQIVVLELCFL